MTTTTRRETLSAQAKDLQNQLAKVTIDIEKVSKSSNDKADAKLQKLAQLEEGLMEKLAEIECQLDDLGADDTPVPGNNSKVLEELERGRKAIEAYKAAKLTQQQAVTVIDMLYVSDHDKALMRSQILCNKVIKQADGSVVSLGQPEPTKPLTASTPAPLTPAPKAAKVEPTKTKEEPQVEATAIDKARAKVEECKQALEQAILELNALMSAAEAVVDEPKQPEQPAPAPVTPAPTKAAKDMKRNVYLEQWQAIGKAVDSGNRKQLQTALKAIKATHSTPLNAKTDDMIKQAVKWLEAEGFKSGIDFQVKQTKATKEVAHKTPTPKAVKAKAMTLAEMKALAKQHNITMDWKAYNMKSSIERAKATADLEAKIAG